MKINTDNLQKIKPVNIVHTASATYTYPYRYRRVHAQEYMDAKLGKVEPNGATVEITDTGNGFYYRYQNNPAVLVTDNGVFGDKNMNIEDLENQAYFILSIMNEHGYVSGFEKE